LNHFRSSRQSQNNRQCRRPLTRPLRYVEVFNLFWRTLNSITSKVNEEITEVDLVEEVDVQAELGIEKITSVDNKSAEKEAESPKLMGVEDKTAESDAKETAIDINEADETHVESAIPQINIQIAEAEVTPGMLSNNPVELLYTHSS